MQKSREQHVLSIWLHQDIPGASGKDWSWRAFQKVPSVFDIGGDTTPAFLWSVPRCLQELWTRVQRTDAGTLQVVVGCASLDETLFLSEL